MSSQFGLTKFNAAGGPTLTVVGQTGSTSSLPATDTNVNDILETALDVEWAHAIAPGANILLVEANSLSSSDLVPAVQTATNYAGCPPSR